MEFQCDQCSARLNLPDDKIPKNVPSISVKCPKCQKPLVLNLKKEETPSSPPQQQAPASPPESPPQQQKKAPAEPPKEEEKPPEPEPPPEPPPEEEFDDSEDVLDDRSLALACFDDSGAQEKAKAALEKLEYAVHVPSKPAEAVRRIGRNRYSVVIVHDKYGGDADKNLLMQALAPMPMAQRRHMCVGLVGDGLRTFDNMMAFAKSVSFVVAEGDLEKLEQIVKQAVTDNDKFYSVFRDILQEIGKG